MIENFSVTWRNKGHWDIYDYEKNKRIFRIRGEAEEWVLIDERESPYKYTTFLRFSTCTQHLCDIMMYEEENGN